ncbi:MAG: hypothetical protein IJR66_02870 [Clostridia bacterium]|nr:hypothetical protein [Clostridia bacterium]
MKTARIQKLLILSVGLLLSVIFAIVFMNNGVANATKINPSASNYFSYINSTFAGSDITFNDEKDTVKIKMKDGDKVAINNELVIDDFFMELFYPENATAVKVNFVSSSYIVTGNKKSATQFDTEITNTVKITDNKAQLNNGEEKSITIEEDKKVLLQVRVIDGEMTVRVNGIPLDNDATENNYYKIKSVDKSVARISFETSATEQTALEILSISQKSGDENYKQTFAIEENQLKEAYGRAVLTSSFFNGSTVQNQESCTETDVKDGKVYTFSPTVYAVITQSAGDVVSTDDNVYLEKSGSQYKFSVNDEDANITLTIKNANGDEIEKYYVKSVADDTTAPCYIEDNGDAIESFIYKLNENLKKTYEEDGQEHYIRIGSSEYLTLPSMESLVYDDITNYTNLKKTVYYMTDEESSSYSSLKLPIKTAGNYSFYVVFEDESGNKIDTEDFYKLNDDNVSITEGKYYAYYFTGITILDDAPMSVKASNQGEGFVDVEYTATSFKISASSYTTKYKLYYSATEIDVNAEGWVEIIASADATDEDAKYNGYSYDDIQKINYNGTMTFTPNQKGFYKIECTVVPTNSAIPSKTDSAIITVSEEVITVRPASHWLKDHVWSVVFLSVGTLCLIAIIVLLFIKPKEPINTEIERKVRVIRKK